MSELPGGRGKRGKPEPDLPKGIVKKHFDQGMRNAYDTLHSQYTGFHSRQVELVAKKKVTDRRTQFLTHLATSMKAWYAEVCHSSEVEIQIATFGDDCMLIASNDDATAKQAYKRFVANEAGSFIGTLQGMGAAAVKRASRSVANDAFRTARHGGKLAKELGGEREGAMPKLLELEAEGAAVCIELDVSTATGEEIANFLKGKVDGKFVALVTASATDMHAEQKILLGLSKAAPYVERTTAVTCAGTFRPCRGCFESLSVVRRYGFQNLQFGVRPGHHWKTTTDAHAEILKTLIAGGFVSPAQRRDDFDANGLLIGLSKTSHRPKLRLRSRAEVDELHYATDSDSDEE